MSTKIAPWLQGLDETWDVPNNNAEDIASSASGSQDNHKPWRSVSGSQDPTSTVQMQRSPLAPLSKANANSMAYSNGTTRMAGHRSVSFSSGQSGCEYDTVQQRPKSASPTKAQETLEWKRRLVRGGVGYSDQTDLFGPSGLENLFARPKGPENEAPKPKNRMNWLQKSTDVHSNARPFSSEVGNHQRTDQAEHGSQRNDTLCSSEGDNSARSDPFNLHVTDVVENSPQSEKTARPDKADERGGSRVVSGQTVLDQEDFSPVFLSKHTSVDGRIDYAPMDSHAMKQLETMRIQVRHPSDDENMQPNVDSEDSAIINSQLLNDTAAIGADFSLSENLPMGTPPLSRLNPNVEITRGGYSNIGSFKNRSLSPSPSKDDLSLPQETSQLPSRPLPSTPLRPVTPNPSKSRSSGSHLKLFAAHDTFTNKRLLRRMSQLDPDGNPYAEEQQTSETDSGTVRQHVTPFGSGSLNGHTFDAEITVTGASNSSGDQTPGSDVPVPGSKAPIRFRVESTPSNDEESEVKRKKPPHAAHSSSHSKIHHPRVSALQPTVEDASDMDAYHQRDGCKRPPTSPFKDPTPKRRRTLHASELDDDMSEANRSYHQHLHELSTSRARKEVHRHKRSAQAYPSSRRLSRPRNPTPSQRRREQIEAEIIEATDEFAAREPRMLEAVMDQLESSAVDPDGPNTLQQQAEAVAAEVANFTFRIQKPSGEHGKRKPSVTTQDFLNEAMMVMQLIRSRARPRSNLGSVEESDAEALTSRIEESAQNGSSLRISRPPSREGGHSGWRSAANSTPKDARVVSHLRKFQENNDTEFIAASVASLRIDDDRHSALMINEPAQITVRPPSTIPDVDDEQTRQYCHSQRSRASTLHTYKSSTGRTVNTCSTRKTDHVGTLAPEEVAHLIGKEVGGMVFDDRQQRWIKAKSAPKKSKSTHLEPPSTLTSDDDPFREISDLRVDARQEADHVGQSSSGTTMNFRQVTWDSNMRHSSNETVISRPLTSHNTHPPRRAQHSHSSSAPSRYPTPGSFQDGKPTSWTEEELSKMAEKTKAKQEPLAYAAAQATLAMQRERDVIHEETENSDASLPGPLDHHPGNISEQASGAAEVESAVEDSEISIQPIRSSRLRNTPKRVSSTTRRGRPTVSLRKQTLTNQLTSDLAERSELSLIASLPGERMMSVAVSVSRPRTTTDPSRIAEIPSSPSKIAGLSTTFPWSDLNDFTISEEDEERPSERALAARIARHTAAGSNDRYALAVKDLVKTLTDVQEKEPYWEDLKQLDLHHRSLSSLVGLEDFCRRLEEMDVSQNDLTQLDGAPSSIRILRACHNRLSSITHWGQLSNLQYLNLSNNLLDSLHGLSHLVHLREIIADDNQITSIDGIFALDGLLKLRLRRNKLQRIDFGTSYLKRLTDLDLSDNDISIVENIDRLDDLTTLRLDGNMLPSGVRTSHSMAKLKTLSLRDSGVETLSVGVFPGLQSLNVDDNRLPTITEISNLHLTVLSMRRQTLPQATPLSILSQPLDTRILNLSGNVLQALNFTHSFLDLRTLELASVGLQSLPEDFGILMPNLRTLNLNFNNLSDIRPLVNIQNLQTLTLCGNRIDRLRKSAATLSKLPTLRELDIRDNPLTRGFYPPVITQLREGCVAVATSTEEVDGDGDEGRYSLPPASQTEDVSHMGKSDDETKLRRRVYGLLAAHNCSHLERLDGLPFERELVGVRDEVWERLLELGVVRRSN
ncbi:hypothetical protein K470DRAFT_257329 [Piedraia hortae CBS 480.64]|uniref:L domain-like protein n=1 Tax=Piedraia hortae CBS 480.64 TaxID=1314780 RepID=A0A6A7C1U8_9PEZI|nr:hypothetical protein K470DRAFT_257329 [Piedraia hortae CBS 480.64]